MNKQDKFYLDHRIDEKIIFPATGYIFIIWRILAFINKKEMYEMELIYENFQIHQALILNINTDLIVLIIHFDDDSYSVRNKNTLLCTGKARAADSLNFDHDYLNDELVNDKNSIILDRLQFYKEIRIRGYEYGKRFQCVEKINSNGTMSIVQYNDNWVTFLDSILQIFVLSNNDAKLHLPVGFEWLKVSPNNIEIFLSSSSSLSASNSYFKVYHNRNLKLINIRDCFEMKYLTHVAPRSIFKKPELEWHMFTPFDRKINRFPKFFNLNLKKLIMNEFESGLISIHENKVAEFQNILYWSRQGGTVRKSIRQLIENIFTKDHYKLNTITIENDKSVENYSVDLILIDSISLSKNIIFKFKSLLANNGFVLAIIDLISFYILEESLKTSSNQDISHMTIVSKLILNDHIAVVLLKKIVKQIKDQTFVYIETHLFEWIDELKNKLKVIQNRPEGHNLWLVTNDCHSNGIIGLINCLRREPGGHRVRCILQDMLSKLDNGN